MSWKKNRMTDPQYLMDMRRPTFIVSRAVGLSAQRLIGAQPRWMFLDLMASVKELIATRPQIPSVTLPSDLSEMNTIEQTIAESVSPEEKKSARNMPTVEKRIARKLRKVLGI